MNTAATANEDPRVRLFVAIDLPTAERRLLVAQREGLLAGARAVPEDQLHLTLRFIGDLARADVHPLNEALAAIEAGPISLTLEGGGCFPGRGEPHVVFAGLAPSPPLLALVAQIESALESQGLPRETKPFHPHITLARPKHVPRRALAPLLDRLSRFRGLPFSASVFRLYSSVLAKDGATHQVEAEFPLNAALR